MKKPTEIRERIVKLIPEELRHADLEPALPLREQGFDSLDWMMLLFNVEREFEIKLSKSVAAKVASIDDLVSAVGEHPRD